LEPRLGHRVAGDQLTADEVKAFVTALKDTVNDLDHADIADIAAKRTCTNNSGSKSPITPTGGFDKYEGSTPVVRLSEDGKKRLGDLVRELREWRTTSLTSESGFRRLDVT
jgi:hypothetical protein